VAIRSIDLSSSRGEELRQGLITASRLYLEYLESALRPPASVAVPLGRPDDTFAIIGTPDSIERLAKSCRDWPQSEQSKPR
jgi:hypothetical protein